MQSTRGALFTKIDGHEVSVYMDDDKMGPGCFGACSKCGDENDSVARYLGTKVLEVHEDGVKLSPNNKLFKEVKRRMDSCGTIGKDLCGVCVIEYGAWGIFEELMS
jgi:hypothetical protein